MARKRDRIDSDFGTKKCAKRYNPSEDRISRLPDDILVDILSLLPLEEAARTGVLSSRWTNLWKHTTCLNLDGERGLDEIQKNHKIRDKVIKSESCKYVSWVDRILRSHKALNLKEFRIRSALDRKHKKSITQWIEFAFAKQVRRLELDLQHYSDSSMYYRFPEELLAQSSDGSRTSPPPSNCFYIHRPHIFIGFKSLREMIFRNVNVSGGAIEFFLSNCPFLEQLIVHKSTKITNLEACGPSLMLKHFEISYCSGLVSLKISAPRLTYLRAATYDGFLLENVPMLVEIDCNCKDTEISLRQLFSTLACCPQLETLHLVLLSREEMKELCNLPQLPKLKKLVINYLAIGRESLVRLTGFIRASPCLEEFVLKYEWNCLPKTDTEVKDAITSPHHHLKVVKFSGYYGRTNDLEFIKYILDNCVVLEKLIIDPSSANASRNIVDVERTARKNAKRQLGARVPQNIELVIL